MEQTRIYAPRPLERVVILGMGMSIVNWFNDLYNDPTLPSKCEVWTVNWAAIAYQHHLAFNSHNFNDPEYKKLCDVVYKDRTLPLITLFAQEDMPFTYSYPIKEVLETFNTTYLTNGVGYMAAYAALCQAKFGGLKMVRFYGCDYNYAVPGMENRREEGRGCVEYWSGILHQLGVDVGCAESSQLFDTCPRLQNGLYGWGHNQPEIEVKEVEPEKAQVFFKGFAQPSPFPAISDSIEKAQANGDARQP